MNKSRNQHRDQIQQPLSLFWEEKNIMSKFRFTILSLLLILAMALVACGGGTQEATPTEVPAEAGPTEEAAPEEPAA